MDQHIFWNKTDYYIDEAGWPDVYTWWHDMQSQTVQNDSQSDIDYTGIFQPDITYQDNFIQELSKEQLWALNTANTLRVYFNPCVAFCVIIHVILILILMSCTSYCRLIYKQPYFVGIMVTSALFMGSVLLTWMSFIGIDVYSVPGTCQFNAFLNQASHFLYTWLMVALVVDHFTAQLIALQKCPKWMTIIRPLGRSKVVILIIATISLAVFLNLSLMEGAVHFGTAKICVVIAEYLETSLVLDKIDLILNSYFPFFIIIFIDIGIIMNYCKLKLRNIHPTNHDAEICQPIRAFSASRTPSPEKPEEDNQTTAKEEFLFLSKYFITTVFIAAVFITLSLPNIIQKTMTTFADDHLIFSISARAVLYQHVFACVFYSMFIVNNILICTVAYNAKLLDNIISNPHDKYEMRPVGYIKTIQVEEQGFQNTSTGVGTITTEFISTPNSLEIHTDV